MEHNDSHLAIAVVGIITVTGETRVTGYHKSIQQKTISYGV